LDAAGWARSTWAFDERLNRTVAVKVMMGSFGKAPIGFRNRWKRGNQFTLQGGGSRETVARMPQRGDDAAPTLTIGG